MVNPPPKKTWQMMTFLNPLDALIPKILFFIFFGRIWGSGHLRGPGVSLSRILGGPSHVGCSGSVTPYQRMMGLTTGGGGLSTPGGRAFNSGGAGSIQPCVGATTVGHQCHSAGDGVGSTPALRQPLGPFGGGQWGGSAAGCVGSRTFLGLDGPLRNIGGCL